MTSRVWYVDGREVVGLTHAASPAGGDIQRPRIIKSRSGEQARNLGYVVSDGSASSMYRRRYLSAARPECRRDLTPFVWVHPAHAVRAFARGEDGPAAAQL